MAFRCVAACSAFVILCVGPAAGLFAQQPPNAPSAVAVLGTTSYWRMHQTLRPPVLQTAGAPKPLLLNLPWVDRPSPAPAPDWADPAFDDSRWLRGPAGLVCPTPYLARLCLRGKFAVADPARVRGLKLTVAYHGGVVVHLNGQEVARAHVPPGPAELAEEYPPDAFLAKDGALLTFEAARRTVPAQDPRRRAMHRQLEDLAIPSRLLRPGVNVLAVEVLRAPYPQVVDQKKDPKQGYWNFAWDTCQVHRVQLTASSAEGLVPNAARPPGWQAWNGNVMAADYDLDYGDRNEDLRPVEIAAARNGCFSGKLVVGDSLPIRNLKAVAGDLKGPGGAIPASAITVRCGLPWGQDEITVPYGRYAYPAEAGLLGCLSAALPEEIPVRAKKLASAFREAPGEPEPVFGAVAPLWITVRVPKDARAGAYEGRLTVQADGQPALTAPLKLQVADWTLPDSQDFRTSAEIIQSPDTLAMEYQVPLWSQRHWELIAESFALLKDSGSRFLHVPLIAETNFGHEQSMVRWVPKGSGRYDYDFSVMDRYLDLAQKHLGKPKFVVLFVWDVYMLQKGGGGSGANQSEQANLMKGLEERGVLLGQGPVVTAAATGDQKAQNIILPRYTEADSKAQWKPLLEQLRRRLADRGLEAAMTLGMLTDAWPTKQEVAALAELAPGVPWAAHAHFGAGGSTVYGLAKVAYEIRVWGIQAAGQKSLMGWNKPAVLNRYFRQAGFDRYPTATWRTICEYSITGNQRGVGRLGGEFWEVMRDKAGQRKGRIYQRYPHSNWRNLDIYTSLLAPGPDGPAATHHYQNLIEGIQECEARIAIERALSDEAARARLGPELAGRCQAVLDERLRCVQLCFCQLVNRLNYSPGHTSSTGGPGIAPHFWYVSSGWEQRAAELFALAGQVQRALGNP